MENNHADDTSGSITPTNITRYTTPDSRLHPRSLGVAVFTAITLALIATKLAQYVNPFMLVGIISVLSAAVSEGYKHAFSSIENRMVATLERRGLVRVEPPSSSDDAAKDSVPSIAEARATSTPQIFHRILLNRVLRSRWAIPLTFACTALLTVSGSFLANHIDSHSPVEFRQSIVKSGVSANNLRDVADKASKEAGQSKTQAVSQAQSLINSSKAELVKKILTLQSQISTEHTDTTTLTKELLALQLRVQLLENAQNSPTSTTPSPGSTTTATSAPPRSPTPTVTPTRTPVPSRSPSPSSTGASS